MQASEELLRTLMVRGLNGDAPSHEALLRALAQVLRAYFRRRLGASDDVEDLVQETLIAVHMRRVSYDRARPFTPWAYAIARYKLMDHFRRFGRQPPIEELTESNASECFEEEYLARIDVEKLLAGLPAKQQMAIRAAKIEGESIADVAEASGLSESDVKISIHRGLKSLAAKLRRS